MANLGDILGSSLPGFLPPAAASRLMAMTAESDPAQGMRHPGSDPELSGEIAINKRRSNHSSIVLRNLVAHIVDPTPPGPGDPFPPCPRRRAPVVGSHRFDKVKEPPQVRAADAAAGS